jgi:predicted nucleic acid-binding Zn ribbon protein
MEDEPVKTCPECGGDVHRLIQPVGIIFKGSGFYVTDNRAKSSTATPGNVKKSDEGRSDTSTEPSKESSKADSED